MVNIDRFDDYIRRVEDREELERLSQEVRVAVAPFNPGDMWIAHETQMSTGAHHIHVSFKNWPSMDTVFDISRLDMIRYPEDSYMHVMRMIRNHLCNIPYIKPDPNIELGEN